MWREPDIHNFEDQEVPKEVVIKPVRIYSLYLYFVQFVLGPDDRLKCNRVWKAATQVFPNDP